MTPPTISGLSELSLKYDAFILDLWGVVHDGIAPYPGVRETLEKLRALKTQTLMLSNAPRRVQRIEASLTDMGIERALYTHVMSSGEATWLALNQRSDPEFKALGRRFVFLGRDGDDVLADGLEYEPTDVSKADFLLVTGPHLVEGTLADSADLLAAARKRNLPLVCANPDLVVVHGGKLLLCAGGVAAEYRRLGGATILRGKPDPAIYKLSLDLLGIADRKRILCIGDAFATDIAGAQGMGLDSMLVTGGIHAEEFGSVGGGLPDATKLTAAIKARDGLAPTYVTGQLKW